MDPDPGGSPLWESVMAPAKTMWGLRGLNLSYRKSKRFNISSRRACFLQSEACFRQNGSSRPAKTVAAIEENCTGAEIGKG